jgi:hypothetical protein
LSVFFILWLSLVGTTSPEIAAITGHEIDRLAKILETYLPRDSIIAEHAIVKLEAWKKEVAARAKKLPAARDGPGAADFEPTLNVSVPGSRNPLE